MNFLMVRRLILKDWYLNRWLILGAVPLGLAALALDLTGSRSPFSQHHPSFASSSSAPARS